jgi:hypothetical protein
VLEKLKNLPPGIDGVRAIGKLSKEDYEQVFVPLLDEARREGRRVRRSQHEQLRLRQGPGIETE